MSTKSKNTRELVLCCGFLCEDTCLLVISRAHCFIPITVVDLKPIAVDTLTSVVVFFCFSLELLPYSF